MLNFKLLINDIHFLPSSLHQHYPFTIFANTTQDHAEIQYLLPQKKEKVFFLRLVVSISKKTLDMLTLNSTH
jgi:hypothetical protein